LLAEVIGRSAVARCGDREWRLPGRYCDRSAITGGPRSGLSGGPFRRWLPGGFGGARAPASTVPARWGLCGPPTVPVRRLAYCAAGQSI